MIDLHCHMLPNVDDGPRNLSEALALVEAAVANGIHSAVVTTHIYPQRWDNRRSSLMQKLYAFKQYVLAKQVPIDLRLGGEVRLSADILPLLQEDEIPFLGIVGGYRIMLLEMPDAMIPLGSETLIKTLLSQGIRPLLAHPERNKAVMANIERLAPFIELGCWVQVTAGSVLGQFGTVAKNTVLHLIQRDWVHVMATDCHNLQYRPPNLREARTVVAEQFGEDYADRLVQSHPAKIVGIT